MKYDWGGIYYGFEEKKRIKAHMREFEELMRKLFVTLFDHNFTKINLISLKTLLYDVLV